MSAKEKAIELVDRYSELGIGHPTSLLLAKQCALIAVDEILNEPDCSEAFWSDVKQEIINL
jgi:hypothetical protein